MRAQLVLGRAGAAQRAAKAAHRVRDDAADQILLVREVVMERRDVDADHRRDLAGPQTLEATRREHRVGGGDQGVLPGLGPRLGLDRHLTFNQSDD